ncbi:MAG: phage terminase small subunit P27 family [Planctomycetota bacterium]
MGLKPLGSENTTWRLQQRHDGQARTASHADHWLDKEAKAAWRRLVPQLDNMGVLTRVDGNALARYCRLWSRWKKAEEFLMERGEVYLAKDQNGQLKDVKPYPQVRIAAQLTEQLLRLEAQFGLTPASRARLEAPQQQDSQHGHDKRKYLNLG